MVRLHRSKGPPVSSRYKRNARVPLRSWCASVSSGAGPADGRTRRDRLPCHAAILRHWYAQVATLVDAYPPTCRRAVVIPRCGVFPARSKVWSTCFLPSSGAGQRRTRMNDNAGCGVRLEGAGVTSRPRFGTSRRGMRFGTRHQSLPNLRPFLCTRSDNVSSVEKTGSNQAASTPPSKV
jgi:hypothetical protein